MHTLSGAIVCTMSRERVTLGSLLEEPLLRSSTVIAGDDALERPVSWCLPWSVAIRGTEAVQHTLVHVDEDLSPAVVDALCREMPTFHARSVSALAVNASEPGGLLREAARAAGLPLLGLPEQTAHLALSRLVAEKNLANEAHVLRYGVTVHHALGEVLYRGAGLSAMANQVRRLSGCSVLMLDTHLEFLVSDLVGVEPSLAEEVAACVRAKITSGELVIGPPNSKATALTAAAAREVTVVTAPIVLGGTTYGWLLLLEREHPPHRHDLAQHLVLAGEAATITGSEMLRLRSVESAVERARGDFVHALLHGRFSNAHEVASRASHHGFDVGAAYGVIALAGAFDTSTPAGLERQGSLLQGVRRMRPASGQPVLATAVGDLLVVVAQLGPGVPPRDVPAEQGMLTAFGEEIAGEVRKRVGGEVMAAFGRPAIGAAGVAASYREARIALGIAQRLGLSGPCGYAQLHSYAALADLSRSPQALTFAHDVLDPLRGRDFAGAELLNVVMNYIESGGNVNAAARRLHLHRNTLFNKLDRASRLLQLDVREPEAMFRIWLAHRIDLLSSVDAAVSAELGPAADPASEGAGAAPGPAASLLDGPAS
jgi:sugar diacid utilization regulator